MQVSHDEIIEMAISGHASTRDAIRWEIEQECAECERLCRELAEEKTNSAMYRKGALWSAIRIAARRNPSGA